MNNTLGYTIHRQGDELGFRVNNFSQALTKKRFLWLIDKFNKSISDNDFQYITSLNFASEDDINSDVTFELHDSMAFIQYVRDEYNSAIYFNIDEVLDLLDDFKDGRLFHTDFGDCKKLFFTTPDNMPVLE